MLWSFNHGRMANWNFDLKMFFMILDEAVATNADSNK